MTNEDEVELTLGGQKKISVKLINFLRDRELIFTVDGLHLVNKSPL
ncbi:MAG: hypothetical protein SAK42_09075 [Oscillatoria sp. PMC 1076.18]|nr:hypothetical protein [Oscillatoria sp. PMC 1076.18]